MFGLNLSSAPRLGQLPDDTKRSAPCSARGTKPQRKLPRTLNQQHGPKAAAWPRNHRYKWHAVFCSTDHVDGVNDPRTLNHLRAGKMFAGWYAKTNHPMSAFVFLSDVYTHSSDPTSSELNQLLQGSPALLAPSDIDTSAAVSCATSAKSSDKVPGPDARTLGRSGSGKTRHVERKWPIYLAVENLRQSIFHEPLLASDQGFRQLYDPAST